LCRICGNAGIKRRHLETVAGTWKRELLENEKIDHFAHSGSEVLYVVGRRADVQQDVSNVSIRSDGKPRVKISDVECTVHILRLSSYRSLSCGGSKFSTKSDLVLPFSISSTFSFSKAHPVVFPLVSTSLPSFHLSFLLKCVLEGSSYARPC